MAEGTSKLSHRNYDIVPVPRLRRQGSETIQGCSRSARSPIPNPGAIWHEPLAFPSGLSQRSLHFADRDDRLRLELCGSTDQCSWLSALRPLREECTERRANWLLRIQRIRCSSLLRQQNDVHYERVVELIIDVVGLPLSA